MADMERSVVISVLLDELADDCLENMASTAISLSACALATVGTMLRSDKVSDPSVHVENYAEETVPRYTDWQFRQHFRMSRATFEDLVEWVCPHLPQERTLTAEKKLLATIWLVGNKESYRSVADRFGLGKGSLHRTVLTVCKTLTSLRQEMIRWPDRAQMRIYAEDFERRAGIPGVVGAVDGTYIKIPGPRSEFRSAYICRKGYPAMHLQVVCSPDLLFLHATTGNAGSVHDSRVFRTSDLKDMLEEGVTALPTDCHLLGDSAYPLRDYLLVPFRDNGHLSPVERHFNKAHASTRVEVERSIGLLKGKFRRLKDLDMQQLRDIPFVIFACCVLHNFIIYSNGVDEDDIEVAEAEGEEDTVQGEDVEGNQSGAAKRLSIAHALA